MNRKEERKTIKLLTFKNESTMKPERKAELMKFLWQLFTALVAALTSATAVSSCYTVTLA